MNYAVIEGAGRDDEFVVARFKTLNNAIEFKSSQFSEDEIEDLSIDIVKLIDDTYSTEI